MGFRVGFLTITVLALALALGSSATASAALTESELRGLVMPPYRLGTQVGEDGVWTMETSDGEVAGYIFESRPLAPIAGFAGDPMNLLIILDKDGRFLDVSILEQNEPIFVAGLGPAPFHAFLQQYRGLSIGDSITIDVGRDREMRGSGSTHVYLDGITKATASVRIANESILSAALQVARERMRGIVRRAAALPRQDYREDLDWPALVEQGIARRLTLSNREVQESYAGTLWADDDPDAAAHPDETYLDLWVVDVGPPSIARAALDAETVAVLERTFDRHQEPILVLAHGRHRLVDDDFIRNTEPDRLAAAQDDLPVSLRDADIDIGLADGVPDVEQAMILRADSRLGFDPASPWTFIVRTVREHGSFRPEPGVRDFEIAYHASERFYEAPTTVALAPPWLAALRDRAPTMGVLVLLLAPLSWVMLRRLKWLALRPHFRLIRLGILAVTVGVVGWWAQAQLSIVTPLGIVHSVLEGDSLAFLLYEPVVLLVWAVTLASLAVWGRGFFCGWLCPYGAMQEFTHYLGRFLRLPQVRVHPIDDRRLKRVKYVVLALLIVATLTSTTAADLLVELEPFKTAITLMFNREAPYVLYAVFWLVLGAFLFKGFCRYVCPLGAALALAGKLRRFRWIERRAECGSPCQFCKARCEYGAIEPDGRIDYDECFQCLDCVTIIEDPALCVPERVARKKGRRIVLARA